MKKCLLSSKHLQEVLTNEKGYSVIITEYLFLHIPEPFHQAR